MCRFFHRVVVLIPFISHFADGQTLAVGEGISVLLRDMTPEQIFSNYARHIGIGGIAMAGVIGIIRSSSIIKQALGLAVSELGGKKKGEGAVERTQRDISMKFILSGSFHIDCYFCVLPIWSVG